MLPLDPERAGPDDPYRDAVALDDARSDLAVLRGQPLRPEVGGTLKMSR